MRVGTGRRPQRWIEFVDGLEPRALARRGVDAECDLAPFWRVDARLFGEGAPGRLVESYVTLTVVFSPWADRTLELNSRCRAARVVNAVGDHDG